MYIVFTLRNFPGFTFRYFQEFIENYFSSGISKLTKNLRDKCCLLVRILAFISNQ